MKYRVIWTKAAKMELAAAWMAASDRNAVTQDSYELEQELSFDPFRKSESRVSHLNRIILSHSLSLWFEVIPDDAKVIVHHINLIS